MTKAAGGSDIDYQELRNALVAAGDDAELFEAIVNQPFETHKVQTAFLFLGIIVLLQVNKKTKTIDRVALSRTELAKNTTDVSAKRFEDIKIPLGYPGNVIAKAIQIGKPQETTDWQNLFCPELTAEEARMNQASGGISYSAIYPLGARDGGALIFSYFQYLQDIGDPQHTFMQRYAALVDELLAKPAG